MRFGVALESFTPPGKNPSFESMHRMAYTAEALGFDSVWVWDHVLLGSRRVYPVLDSLTTLMAIGARTRRIKLGTSVLILSLRNPVVLSKVLTTIQYLTEGRLILGAAAGWYKREFDTIGVNYSRRGKIFEERFKLVRRLLDESDVTYKSNGVSLEHASMEPKSPDRIPMLIGGYADVVLRRAGELADGWISYYYAPEGFARSWKLVSESARAKGRNGLRRVNIVPLAVAESFDEGDMIAREFTARYMDLPKNTLCTVESAIRGTPSQCIEQVEKYRTAGVEDLIFIPCNYEISYVEKAGKEIIPRFAQ
jgi:alkanesulfonate monooxygenase SsuD/methylene tetrahydromethanopterin reductase-like flavin-dependent oxidoreductase (luciferase family)